MTTDFPSTFADHDLMKVVGYDMTAAAAAAAYAEAGIGPEDVNVAEMHDCFTANELITYEGLGFCPAGGAEKFIADGDKHLRRQASSPTRRAGCCRRAIRSAPPASRNATN